MEIYTGVIYPLVLIVAAVLAVTGIVTLLYPPAHRVLQWAVSATWGAVGVHLVAVVIEIAPSAADEYKCYTGFNEPACEQCLLTDTRCAVGVAGRL